MENQENKQTIDGFIKEAQLDAKRMILAAKIKKVMTNVMIGAIVVVAVVGAIVVVGAIEKANEQVPAIEPVVPTEEVPAEEQKEM